MPSGWPNRDRRSKTMPRKNMCQPCCSYVAPSRGYRVCKFAYKFPAFHESGMGASSQPTNKPTVANFHWILRQQSRCALLSQHATTLLLDLRRYPRRSVELKLNTAAKRDYQLKVWAAQSGSWFAPLKFNLYSLNTGTTGTHCVLLSAAGGGIYEQREGFCN